MSGLDEFMPKRTDDIVFDEFGVRWHSSDGIQFNRSWRGYMVGHNPGECPCHRGEGIYAHRYFFNTNFLDLNQYSPETLEVNK